SHMLSTVETLTTPLLAQIAVFGRWLTGVILLVAASLLAYGYYIQGQSFSELFMAIVGLSVAAIPEGLPAVLTITLAIGVQAMARRSAIVRRLPIIETIGSVSVICTDKTGTLTKNEMTVSTVATLGQLYDIEGSGYKPKGRIYDQDQAVDLKQDAALAKLVQAGMLCNDATLTEQAEGQWTVRGDPMEGALLVLGRKAGLTEQQQEVECPRNDIIPFDTDQQYMATLHCAPGQSYIFIKGAPEKMIGLCRQQYTKTGDRADLDADYWSKKADEIATKGQRVLGFAFIPVADGQTQISADDIDGKAVFLGLTGLMDPPRPEALEAIEECHRAGIKVKMITGDHAATAVAIGRMVGLAHPDAVLTGTDIDNMDDAALADAILETDVFARTSPAHKLRLVTALQAHNLVVAMTGDGANDAPALKRADAGIAMGQKGSDAAREAGDLILIDDNFASIAAAIWAGRTVYDNLKKVISWTIPTNAGEALTIIIALLSGMLLPVTPIQILWINLVTAVTLGIALAFEPMEPGTKKRPPRPRNELLLNKTLVGHICLVSFLMLCAVFGMFKYARIQGYDIELSRTISLNTLVMIEIFHLLYIRNISNVNLTWKAVSGTPVVWLAISIVVIAQLIITYTAPLQIVFETRPVPLAEGLLIIGTGVLFFIIVELEKQIRLRLQKQAVPAD
ncbi:MAG: HAD-IC family P-type ATPase, partial [Pseudomonadota bacterium]